MVGIMSHIPSWSLWFAESWRAPARRLSVARLSRPRVPARVVTCLISVLLLAMGSAAQAQYPLQAPPAPQTPQTPAAPQPAPSVRPPQVGGAGPSPQGSDPQKPLEYAYRPELTNPEFGNCLSLEKNWRGLYQQYYREYEQLRMVDTRDPQYSAYVYRLQQLKQQLDAAWSAFGPCIYFPGRNR
jgi:hypothetical protein